MTRYASTRSRPALAVIISATTPAKAERETYATHQMVCGVNYCALLCASTDAPASKEHFLQNLSWAPASVHASTHAHAVRVKCAGGAFTLGCLQTKTSANQPGPCSYEHMAASTSLLVCLRTALQNKWHRADSWKTSKGINKNVDIPPKPTRLAQRNSPNVASRRFGRFMLKQTKLGNALKKPSSLSSCLSPAAICPKAVAR
eukprot:1161409-Pelagomonas_calceolata.AAC.4